MMKHLNYINNSKPIYALLILFICAFAFEGNSKNSKKERKADYNNITRWYRNKIYMGIPLKNIRYRIKNRDTIYVLGVLKNETILNGYSCHKKVTFKKGKVTDCRLSKEYIIKGFPCYNETGFNANGYLTAFALSRDAKIAGHNFKKDTYTFFTKEGGFGIYCPYHPVIDGIRCKGTNVKLVFFQG